MERKATCYKLLITAVTLRSGSSPQLPQVLGASLLCWEVMTGGSLSTGIFGPLSLCTLCSSPVILHQSGRLDKHQVYVERDPRVLIHTLPFPCCHHPLALWQFQSAPGFCVSVPLFGTPQCNSSPLSLYYHCLFSDHWLSVYHIILHFGVYSYLAKWKCPREKGLFIFFFRSPVPKLASSTQYMLKRLANE